MARALVAGTLRGNAEVILREARPMAEIAKGRFDHRIAEKRKDEFGQLYEVFDAMAGALQADELRDIFKVLRLADRARVSVKNVSVGAIGLCGA